VTPEHTPEFYEMLIGNIGEELKALSYMQASIQQIQNGGGPLEPPEQIEIPDTIDNDMINEEVAESHELIDKWNQAVRGIDPGDFARPAAPGDQGCGGNDAGGIVRR
jgi:hypothetical protein